MKLYEYCCSINSLKTLRHPLHTKVYIGPDNRVLVLRKDWKTAEQESIIFDRNGTYFHSWGSYFFPLNKFLHMNPQIIQHARKILERKHAEQCEENKKNRMETRIARLENSLEKVIKMIEHSGSHSGVKP